MRRGGAEGATKDVGWEGGNKGRVVERGSNDAREGGSGSIGRVGGLRKGTSEELCMVGARGRGEGGSERRREGATEGGRGATREDRRRNGDREGGKLQGRYPGGHWPIYSAKNYPQRGP